MALRDFADFITAVSPCVALFILLVGYLSVLHAENRKRLDRIEKTLNGKE